AVADRDDGDRRERDPALLGQPDPLPARLRGPRGAELVVEVGRAVRLEGRVDRVDRDLPAAGRAGRGTPQRRRRVVDAQAVAAAGAPALEPAADPGAPA